jgi:hypothetical protein
MLGGLFGVGGIRHTAQMNQAASAGESAARAASRMRTENESLRFEMEKLLLITQALWTFLQEQHGYSDEDLIERIQRIDMLDGKLDGKLTRTKVPPDCPECGRKLIGKRPLCLYCGAAVARDPFE